MSCLDCPALPTFMQEAGRLFLWLPTPHTHRKIWQALEAKTEVPVQLLEDLGLVVAIAQGALKKTLETMAEVLSQGEMQASRALFLPGDRDPCWQDCARVESLLQLFHRTQAELLLELLKENRLTTYFQPIVRARDPAWVVGHEALVRGLDREGKVIGPDLLFATAREAGLLYHLDLAARRTAIAAATQHRLEGGAHQQQGAELARRERPGFHAQLQRISTGGSHVGRHRPQAGIVDGPFCRVAEDKVGFLEFLEATNRHLWRQRRSVGMVAFAQLPVGPPNVLRRGPWRQAQPLVVGKRGQRAHASR